MRIPLAVLFLAAPSAPALDPAGVFVVFNSSLPRSKAVADHYATKRGLPAGNLVGLPLPETEEMTRADFDAKLAGPLRDRLAPRRAEVKCLLTVWGVPLRAGPKLPTAGERAEAAKTQAAAATAKAAGDARTEAELTARWADLSGDQSQAAVDSELMLLWWPGHPTGRWLFNPLYWRVKPEDRAKLPPVLVTARLDGPSPEVAMRLVDDALSAEAGGGPAGKAYVDARGMKYDPGNPAQNTGLPGYDQSFREAAGLCRTAGLDTVLDDAEPVFAPNSCPDAGLYLGWYSVGKYVPALTLNRGAVAWHLASYEAVSLRDPANAGWCPGLLRDGAAVTLGPVAEPYSIGFPKPAEFAGFLLTGRYTVAEVLARTTLLTSWQLCLVGDPLYNPYKLKPRLREEQVVPSPK